MNETMLKYARLMIENGEEHLRRVTEWIQTTEKQLEEAKEKEEEIIADMEALKAELPEEEEEDSSDEEG